MFLEGLDALDQKIIPLLIENARISYSYIGQQIGISRVAAKARIQALEQRGIPCALSYTAGTFVCNDLLYTLLHRYRDTDVRVGFAHIPYLPEQAGEGVPSMELDTVVEALTAMIGAMN